MSRAAHANCTRAKEYPDGYGLLLLFMTGSGSGPGHIFIHDNRDVMGRQERENTPFGLLGFCLLRRELTHRYPCFIRSRLFWTFSFFLGLASPYKPDLMA